MAIALASAIALGQEPATALGGETSVPHSGINAFSQPAANLGERDLTRFFVGNSFFKRNWVQAPASATARDGLGPRYNARSCSGCHLLDGRGGSPLFSNNGFVVRLDPNSGQHAIGGQLQDLAISGVAPEGELVVERGSIPDRMSGLGAAAVQPRFLIRVPGSGGGQTTATKTIDQVSLRIGPALIGLGLLEAIPEHEVIAGADANDDNGDGISGRINRVTNHHTGQMELGRFGWKAGMPDVANQVAMALWQDMGITNPLHPEQNCNRADAECALSPSGGSPEISGQLFEALVFYSRSLAPPIARKANNFASGFRIFQKIGCDDCHRPHWNTANEFEIEAFARQSIWPFTDLLLHDMGPGLADEVSEAEAAGPEWRTPPLWGLGLIKKINPNTGYLHDGRAATIEQAVLWHGGEASRALEQFVQLQSRDKAWLLEFLEAL